MRLLMQEARQDLSCRQGLSPAAREKDATASLLSGQTWSGSGFFRTSGFGSRRSQLQGDELQRRQRDEAGASRVAGTLALLP